jgi:DNA-binding protein H-NS
MLLLKGALTMSTLDDLLQQHADLLAKIEAEKASGRATALASVQKMIRDYGLTAEDLKEVISLPVSRAKSQNAALKDQETGPKRRGRPPKIRPDSTT